MTGGDLAGVCGSTAGAEAFRAARCKSRCLRDAARDAAREELLDICSSLRAHRDVGQTRSEEHTSELQSQSNLVCRLLLEKKKIYTTLLVRARVIYNSLVTAAPFS